MSTGDFLKPSEHSEEVDTKPLDFSAYSTLVLAHAKKTEKDGPIVDSWGAFVNPTTESASRLVTAQAVIKSASQPEFSTVLESLRFSHLGRVTLRRDGHISGTSFLYKLQLIRTDGSATVESPVAPSTVITAMRAGISLLALALADDQDFVEKIKLAFYPKTAPKEFANFERHEISTMVEDAKAPKSPRRNSI